jgi:hypothetical protein
VRLAGGVGPGLRTDDLALAMAIAGAVRVRAGVCLMSESITRRRQWRAGRIGDARPYKPSSA